MCENAKDGSETPIASELPERPLRSPSTRAGLPEKTQSIEQKRRVEVQAAYINAGCKEKICC
jgi:hypothetical protein